MNPDLAKRLTAMAKYDDRKKRGVCVRCEAPRVPSIIRCRACADKNSAGGKRYFQRKKGYRLAHMQWYRADHAARGLCAECPKKVKPGSKRCEPCMAKARARYAKRKARAGLPVPRIVRPRSDTAMFFARHGLVSVERAPVPVCLECGNNPPQTGQAICWCCANPPAKVAKPEQAKRHRAAA